MCLLLKKNRGARNLSSKAIPPHSVRITWDIAAETYTNGKNTAVRFSFKNYLIKSWISYSRGPTQQKQFLWWSREMVLSTISGGDKRLPIWPQGFAYMSWTNYVTTVSCIKQRGQLHHVGHSSVFSTIAMTLGYDEAMLIVLQPLVRILTVGAHWAFSDSFHTSSEFCGCFMWQPYILTGSRCCSKCSHAELQFQHDSYLQWLAEQCLVMLYWRWIRYPIPSGFGRFFALCFGIEL